MKSVIFVSVVLFLMSCQPRSNQIVAQETESKSQKEQNSADDKVQEGRVSKVEKIYKTEEEWRAELNDKEFKVLRKEGTERAFTGDLWDNKEKGTYTCRGCQLPLFDSKTKFKSGTGWPSFYQPIDEGHVETDTDYKIGYARTEVHCARCGGHLGHIFNDGPEPTGLRYCINSVSLDFIKE